MLIIGPTQRWYALWMSAIGKSAELQRLDDARQALDTAISALNAHSTVANGRGVEFVLTAYRLEAVRYRLADSNRVAELHRQLATAAPNDLRTHWFTELNQNELLQVFPALVEASLGWTLGGTDDLMEMTVDLLESLPRDQATPIFLGAFTNHLRRWTQDVTFTREEAQRHARRAMSSVDEEIYATRTVQENADALEAIVLNEMDAHSVRVFRGVLALARDAAGI